MRRATLLLLCAAVIALLSGDQTAAAGCGDAEVGVLAQVSQGPYVITVSTMPPQPRMGSLRLVVAVCDARDGQPREDVRATLVPTSPDGRQGAPIYPLLHNTGTGEYRADLTVKAAGIWRYQVEVSGPPGLASFEVSAQVEALSRTGEGSTTAVFLATTGLLVAGGVYLVVASRRLRRAESV
ncbi:MAG: hypothetical protein HYY02_10565 [Chloroflexi bacterium]|nr:hypothetical protein [Chloroflexota bacterium]